jgi:hypothetical protein
VPALTLMEAAGLLLFVNANTAGVPTPDTVAETL